MTGAELETLIRNQTWISASKISSDDLFDYVNIVRNDIRSKIEKWVKPDFWFAKFTWDTVANDNEYNTDDDLTWTGKLFKVKTVEIKWDSTSEYHSRIEPWKISDYWVSRDRLKNEVHEEDAFWTYENNNIVIFPAPSNWIVWGIIAYWPYTFDKIDNTASEWDIFPWHDELIPYESIIALWVIPYLERHRNIKDKADINNSEIAYMNKLNEIIEELNTKYDSVVYWALPNVNHLKV